jgi:hypothetical protein
MSEEEAATRTIDDKNYIVRSVFSEETDKDIKTAVLKLAESKTLREMGIEPPFGFEMDSPQ